MAGPPLAALTGLGALGAAAPSKLCFAVAATAVVTEAERSAGRLDGPTAVAPYGLLRTSATWGQHAMLNYITATVSTCVQDAHNMLNVAGSCRFASSRLSVCRVWHLL